MNYYKLTKYDYALLYPLMKPAEIKSQFGERACSIRGIYKTLENIVDRTSKAEQDRIINKFTDERKLTHGKADIESWIGSALHDARNHLCAEIWERVEEYERRFN